MGTGLYAATRARRRRRAAFAIAALAVAAVVTIARDRPRPGASPDVDTPADLAATPEPARGEPPPPPPIDACHDPAIAAAMIQGCVDAGELRSKFLPVDAAAVGRYVAAGIPAWLDTFHGVACYYPLSDEGRAGMPSGAYAVVPIVPPADGHGRGCGVAIVN
ncbi:MAG: hypothetical protein H6709_11455 [Kofleriaceae bacterium]|nr:hypothetical protein [Kofleriaceae bacterium]MCB9572691.1 hypothetical protein [Kofleriaceae bacterium]